MNRLFKSQAQIIPQQQDIFQDNAPVADRIELDILKGDFPFDDSMYRDAFGLKMLYAKKNTLILL